MVTALRVYLHGAPGGPDELALPGMPPVALWAPDRFLDQPGATFDAWMSDFTARLSEKAGDRGLHLIGFSAGARIALDLAARLPAAVRRLDLVSPIAPFELGDFLPRMEGRPVFGLARRAPWAFPAFAAMQGALAFHAPQRLFRIVFAHPMGRDADLTSRSGFRERTSALLRQSLGPGRKGYQREILAAARPWAKLLDRVAAPTWIWQGELDNWTPPDMARALAARLRAPQALHLMDGLSHYSTLAFALSQIALEPAD